ncbi:MAG: tRNA (N6-isopentenyl adenosine(37)-C2)-methylthiotransferase MiaB [Acidobacteria bacterium]|nr:tRNA (N6-isopentenyl adenosine(37)-C2)-methylthiotransferase MiaB [Acidobacteriota bacterium]
MKKLYLETYGCQMNVHDSEKATFALAQVGYEQTDTPEDADLIMLNTCMVREKAARKVYSRVDALKHERKRAKRDLPVFGVMGCVAQAEAERIFERSPEVKLVMGTQAIGKLPELLGQLEQGFSHAIDVRLTKDAEFFNLDAHARQTPHVAYVTITEGCNKFCSYCIVPFTRGRERSRTPDSIVGEAQRLATQGFKEVHLLGQNVNSYGLSGKLYNSRGGEADAAKALNEITFGKLLDRLARESNLPRIKYTTSFPRDFDREIIEVMDAHENLCPWVHLPVQSGSNRVLRMMRRGYTREDYLEKIALIKQGKKDYSITGDLIVGFPGETEADFLDTMSLVAEVEYDGLYIFKYSPRPHTPAATYTDTLPDEVVTERFMRVNELQRRIQRRRYERLVGHTVEVLVEGISAKSADDYTGHTQCNKVMNFKKQGELLGELAKVKVTQAYQNSLYGELV